MGGEQNEVPVIQGKSASRGVRACQPDFSPGESHGADHPECPDTAQTGQQGIRPRQHGFRKGSSCLTDLIFKNEVTCLVHEAKAVDVAYLDFK